MMNNQETKAAAFFMTPGKKRLIVLFLFAMLAVAGCLVSLMKGAVPVSISEIFQSLLPGSGATNEQIIYNIRLPRTIVAALTGMNLALSGAILQAVMKNPLADPHRTGQVALELD